MPGRRIATKDCRIAELLSAAELGDVESVKKILDEDAEIEPGAVQWTLRRLAPKLGDCWPGWGGQPGSCALHCAAEQGHANVVAARPSRPLH